MEGFGSIVRPFVEERGVNKGTVVEEKGGRGLGL